MLYAIFVFIKIFFGRKGWVRGPAVSCILSKVKFHVPGLHSPNVNFGLLKAAGINFELPIYKITEPLKLKDFLTLKLAQEEVDFNIIFVLCDKKDIKRTEERARKYLKNAIIYHVDFISYSLLAEINKLNINYEGAAGLHFFEKNTLTVNGVCFTEKFVPYHLRAEGIAGDIGVIIKEFVICGKNHMIRLENSAGEMREVKVVYRQMLDEGCYYFNPSGRTVSATEIFKRKTMFLNMSEIPKVLKFSSVQGLEFSRFAKIQVEFSLKLRRREVKYLFFNFGNNEIKSLSPIKMGRLFLQSKKSFDEMFNFKIRSNDPLLDEKVNYQLPKRLAVAFLNGEYDLKAEEEYLSLKSEVFIEVENGILIETKGVFKRLDFSLKIYVKGVYREIKIMHSNEKKTVIDGVNYFNSHFIGYKTLEESREISAFI